MAKQFNVNAKTLSKALTDLAAEGVLQRNIGLGTFVRGSADPAPSTHALLLGESTDCGSLEAALAAHGLAVSTESPKADLPPSLLAPFDVVLICSPAVSDDVVRNLIVRGKDVITVGRASSPYSAHAVMPHTGRAAARAAIDLYRLGHRRLMVVSDDPTAAQAVAEALPNGEVRTVGVESVAAASREGLTAVVCEAALAPKVSEVCREAGIDVPGALSVAGFGRLSCDPHWDGCYVTDGMVASAVADLLTAGLSHKPVTLWLAGETTTFGTAAPPAGDSPVTTAKPFATVTRSTTAT